MQLPTETPQYRRIVSGRSFDSDDDASQIYYGEEEHNTDDELYEVNSNGSGSLHKLSTQLLTEAQTLTKQKSETSSVAQDLGSAAEELILADPDKDWCDLFCDLCTECDGCMEQVRVALHDAVRV